MNKLWLVFEISGFRLAMDASQVVSIAKRPALTPVPALPDYVMGVCNLRGDIVPVVELACLLGLAHQGEYACVFLLRRLGGDVALAVDAARETQTAAVVPQTAPRGSGLPPYVVGMLPDHTTVLDAERLLDAVFVQMEG